MNESNFLPEKYADLPGSKPVERAVDKSIREGNKGPSSKEERVDTYMDRLERITEDERGFELLKYKILNRFAINTEDEESLTKIAEGLYESEKKIAIEQGRGADVSRFESTHDVIEHYKPLILEKSEIQRKTLTSWLDYLQENDAKHPMWFRYYVVRSLEKMGTLDKEKGTYSKRTPRTVAPFPELNSEALGWVYKRVSEGVDPTEELTPEKQAALEKALKGKDFSKLYAFAQIETAGRLNRESLEGEWRKYDQGSDFTILESDLKGKGTGWCTAEGSAASQLESGDFYVYYTKGENDSATEPRVAIRMEGDRVAEVRGVNQRQELEPELVDIAQAQYHTLPGGESYDKKASDMKWVTRLAHKQEQGLPFTKDDLVFLYEIDAPIEGFGYDKDPRIEQLRRTRDPQEDAPIVFECTPEQIAYSLDQITPSTKAYVGKLEPGIFDKLPENIEHIYTSFPEGKIRRFELEFGGKTKEQLEREMKQQGVNIGRYAQSMMDNRDFTTLPKPEQRKLVRLQVKDLGFTGSPTTTELYKRAEELGLELCPPEVGPQYRINYKNQPMGEWVYIGMEPISGSYGGPGVFRVAHREGGLWLHYGWARPGYGWSPSNQIVFGLRKKS